MRKGHYWFRECGALSKVLTISCTISFMICLALIVTGAESGIHKWYVGLIDGRFEFRTVHAWTIFFFTLGNVLMIANICIHKVCRDIAALLKEVEEKK